jgi:hypothetical protein
LFDQKHNYITLDTSILSIPLLTPNTSLLEHFENYARDFLSGIEEVNNIARAVTKQILSRLDSKTLSIGSIAKEMAMSVRTLQNRLPMTNIDKNGQIACTSTVPSGFLMGVKNDLLL